MYRKLVTQHAVLACAFVLSLQAGASAQLLDLRTLNSSVADWSGYPGSFDPDWIGDVDYIVHGLVPQDPIYVSGFDFGGTFPGGGGTGGLIITIGGPGVIGGGSDSFIPWSPPALPEIQKPELYLQHIQTVDYLDHQQSMVTSVHADSPDHTADYGDNTSVAGEQFNHFAQVINLVPNSPAVVVADGRAIAQLDAAAEATGFTASGKVAAAAGAVATRGTPYTPAFANAEASSSVAGQATFELKTITSFDLSTTLAQVGQMNLSVSITREGDSAPLATWSAEQARQITQQTYGVLETGRYTVRVQAQAQAQVDASVFDRPGTITEPVSQSSSFDVDFKLHGLEHWYYTANPDGSGAQYHADSLISVLAPVVESGWVYVRGRIPNNVPADRVVDSPDDLPADLLDTVTYYDGAWLMLDNWADPASGYLQYVDAYWTGQWASVDIPLSELYDDLEATGWFDVNSGQWLDSPLDALRFTLNDLDTATYLAQTTALIANTPEPAAAVFLLAFTAPLMRRRRR